jgi:hypothetical protein
LILAFGKLTIVQLFIIKTVCYLSEKADRSVRFKKEI